ncbi:hypothetical protein GALMADRAFT_587787 [Galerina marginata CBS 339.88]|uniref:Transcription elongation factor Eaf N-terminal domain-containing protein n=1 Tax=Galerina marginata (strain CBS 339.88) TaxID=685588 RepID=A0A067SU96_GALM3|nr:hypothetical protein GALMADRAFT_587787 [Galerina marginata CBS 339.88]
MASSSSSSSWLPAKGRHPVLIGSSLGKVIKNRKLKGSPAPTTKRSTKPDRDFYSFKFNFKASSIDTAKPATIEIKKGAENSRVLAQYPSTQPGEVQLFSGSEQPAKEVDCILIFDEETGTFTLEKLDSFVVLKSEGKKAVSPRPTSPSPAPSVSPNKGKAKQEDYDLDQTMSGLDEDAEGEDDFEEVVPSSAPVKFEEEEEEEGEEIEVPLVQVIRPKPQPPPQKPARAVKPLPSRVEAKAPAATPSQPPKVKVPPPAPPAAAAPPPAMAPAPSKAKAAQPKPKKVKPATPISASIPAPSASYAGEEMEFGKPSKRARPSTPQHPPPKPAPAPRSPVVLSLPAPAPASPVLAPQADTSEDEEDWEQVPTASTAMSQDGNGSTGFDLSLEEELEGDIFGDGFGDAEPYADRDRYGDGDGEEIDENAFAMELDQQMEESEGDVEDDFLAAAVSPEPEQARQPISLNRLASGGGAVGDSDDEFSSSDESDEE